MATQVTKKEIAKRKKNQRITNAVFAVDNLKPNPATKHIFDDYANGRIASVNEAIKKLDKHYGIVR